MKKWIVPLLCAFTFFVFPATVYASDDSVDEERIERIEERLNSHGSSIQEIKDRLSSLDSALETVYQNDLTMQQQLDVLIVGVDSLYQEFVIFHTDFLKQFTLLLDNLLVYKDAIVLEIQSAVTELNTLNDTLLLTNVAIGEMSLALSEQIATSQEATLTELNDTLLVTNNLLIYLFCTLLIVLIAIIAIVLYKLIHGTLIKNII